MCPNEKAGCGSVTPPPVEPPAETPTETPTETPPTETPTETPPTETPTETPPTETPPSGGGGGPKSSKPGHGGTHSGEGSGTSTTTPGSGEGSSSNGSTSTSAPHLGGAAAGVAETVGLNNAHEASGGAIGPAKAVFRTPKASVGGPVVLDGTASKAVGKVHCAWSVEEANGVTRKDKKTGCRVVYRFHHAGVAHVTLVVRGSAGQADRLRKALVVHSDQSGQLRVSRAARAF
jgi:hypothetical protein